MTTADEVDDFNLVVVAEFSCRPFRRTDDFPVQFDRESLCFEVEDQNQVLEGGRPGHLSQFAVNRYVQGKFENLRRRAGLRDGVQWLPRLLQPAPAPPRGPR